MGYRLRDYQDAQDLVRGLTLLGTGGGGSPELGLKLLREALDENLAVGWVEPSDVPCEVWTCTAFGMGTIAPVDSPAGDPYSLGQTVFARPLVEAVRTLERTVGHDVECIVPFELGGANTVRVLDAAARLGKVVPDGDYSGRAVPELVQIAPAIRGWRPWPMVICDDWGNQLIMTGAASAEAAEAIGKMISTISKSRDPLATCGHAGFVISAQDMSRMIAKGTLSMALRAGRAIRLALRSGEDPVAAGAREMGGGVIFLGEVEDKTWEDRNGYMCGMTRLRGAGCFVGEQMRIWFKNENHVAWKNDVPVVTSPDLICVLNSHTGEPVTNTAIAVGESVAVIVKSNAAFRDPAAVQVLGPRHFGFDFDFVPCRG